MKVVDYSSITDSSLLLGSGPAPSAHSQLHIYSSTSKHQQAVVTWSQVVISVAESVLVGRVLALRSNFPYSSSSSVQYRLTTREQTQGIGTNMVLHTAAKQSRPPQLHSYGPICIQQPILKPSSQPSSNQASACNNTSKTCSYWVQPTCQFTKYLLEILLHKSEQSVISYNQHCPAVLLH